MSQHRQPVFKRVVEAFVGIDADGHGEFVEQPDALFNHPEMSDRERIEAARVNSVMPFGPHWSRLSRRWNNSIRGALTVRVPVRRRTPSGPRTQYQSWANHPGKA